MKIERIKQIQKSLLSLAFQISPTLASFLLIIYLRLMAKVL